MATNYQFGIRLAVEGEGEVVAATDRAGKGFTDMGERAGSVGRVTDELFGKLKNLAIAYVGTQTVREFIQTADAMNAVDGRLRNVTASTADYTAAKGELYRISQQNNVSLQDSTTLFTRILDPVTKMGGGVQHATTMVAALSAGLRVNNATQSESSSAILQFSQAMASGVLRGEEFNSVNEAAPQFLAALASALGVGRGELREMAEDGKLTADVVGNAMPRALAILEAQAAGLPETMGSAMSDVRNEAGLLAQKIDQTSGATSGLTELVGAGALLMAQFGRVLDSTTDSTQLAGAGFDKTGLAIRIVGTIAEVVLVVMANVTYMLGAIGREAGGLAAQVAAVAQFNFAEAKQIGVEMRADAEAARAQLNKYEQSVVGMTDKVLQQRDALKLNTGSASENNAEMAKLTRQTELTGGGLSQLKVATDAASKAKDEAAKAAKAAAKEYENLLGSYSKALDASVAKTKNSMLEADEQRKLTEVETIAIRIMADVSSGKAKLNDLIKNGTMARIAMGLAQEETNRLLQAEKAWLAESTAETAKSVEAIVKRAEALEASNRKLAEEGEVTRAGKDYQHAITTARIADRAAILEQRAAALDLLGTSSGMAEALRREAAALYTTIEYKDHSAHAEYRDKLRDQTAALVDQVSKERDATATQIAAAQATGAATVELASLIRQKYEDLAVQKERRAAIMDEIDADLAAEYRAQAVELRKLGDMKAEGVHVKAAEDAKAAWKSTTDSIHNGLTDSLFRAFESGKGFWSTLWGGIVNTFKTTILKPIIQDVLSPFAQAWQSIANWISSTVIKPVISAVVSPITGGIQAFFTGQDAGGGAGGLISNAGSASSLYGAYQSGALGGNVSSAGAAISGWWNGTAIGGSGSLPINAALAESAAAGSAGAGAGGAGAGAGGGWAAAAGPVAMAAFAAFIIAGMMKDDPYGPRVYSQVGVNPLTGAVGQIGEPGRGSDVALPGADVAALAATQAVNGVLAALGSSARISEFRAGALSNEQGTTGMGGVYAGGRLTTGAAFGESGQGHILGGAVFDPATSRPLFEAGSENLGHGDATAAYNLDLLQASIQALQAVEDLPSIIKDYVRAYDAESLNATDASGMLRRVAELAEQTRQATVAAQVVADGKKYPTSSSTDYSAMTANVGTVSIAMPAGVSTALQDIGGMADLLEEVRVQIYHSEQEIINRLLGDGVALRTHLTAELQATRVQVYNSEQAIILGGNGDSERIRYAIYDSAANETVSRNSIVDELKQLRAEVAAQSQKIREQIYYSEQTLLYPLNTTANTLQRVTRDGSAMVTVAA